MKTNWLVGKLRAGYSKRLFDTKGADEAVVDQEVAKILRGVRFRAQLARYFPRLTLIFRWSGVNFSKRAKAFSEQIDAAKEAKTNTSASETNSKNGTFTEKKT